MMMRSKTEINITAGGLHPIDFENFGLVSTFLSLSDAINFIIFGDNFL